jgi:methyl-accepting chemotaxis protein
MAFGDNLHTWFPRELRIGHKLALVCLAFGIPIAALLYFLVREQQKPIDFARKELYGTAYLRPCRSLLQHVWEHRLLAHRQLSGEPVSSRELTDRPLNITNDLKALDEVERLYGLTLSQPPERTTQQYLTTIKQRWQEIQRQQPNLKPEASDELHAALIRDIRALVALVGDASNLILDPDLDSYYVMDSVLLKLPEAQDLLGQLLDYGEEVVARKTLTPEEKTQLVVKTGLLRSLHDNLSSPLGGLPVAYKKINDSTPDKVLEARLAPALNRSVSATDQYLEKIQKRILEAPQVGMTPAEYASEAVQALEASFTLWDDAVKNLDELLQQRIAGFRRGQYTVLALGGLAVVVALLLVFGIVRGFTRQISAMQELSGQLGTGNYQARAAVITRDELGNVAGSFNAVLDNILSLIQSREERDQIQASITKLLDEVSGVAHGDLTKEAEVTADVTGAIADSFNYMIEQLRQIIGNVQEATVQVSTSANQIQAAAEQVAQGSDAQAEQIGQTSAAIDEMAVSIQQVSENAALSATVAQQALAGAKQGSDAVRNTIQGMNRIRDQVQETAKRIKRLGESSQEIGQIIQLIDDIADRTSILALNASIQAAAAGEAGRGFAVVAEEVERLAERSTEATKKIATLVKTIQGETGEAVAAMEKGIHEVVDGSKLANQAGKALDEIEAVSNHLAELIGSISLTSQQQARGSEALAKSMGAIAQSTQQAAAGTKQAAESVSQLAVLADELRASVSTFQLPDGKGPAADDSFILRRKRKHATTGKAEGSGRQRNGHGVLTQN